MRIHKISIKNLRCLAEFALEPAGSSLFLIGENGSGKTTVLDAIARSAGQGRRITRADFGDLDRPIEIEVTYSDLAAGQRGVFADEIDFVQPVTVTLGVRAVWDSDQEVVDVVHGFPRRDWRKSKREQRDSIELEWLPEKRDIPAMLALGKRRNLIGRLLEELQLQEIVKEAVAGIEAVREQLGQDSVLLGLLTGARENLALLVPAVSEQAFSLGSTEMTARELLADLELLLAHFGEPLSLQEQSSGLGQLTAFAFAMHLINRQKGGILLVDEPETSLHPQAQRALMRGLRTLKCQTLIATHSSSLLDRADPRTVARLFRRTGGTVDAVRPEELGEEESRRFARFSTPHTAEAFFAQGAILVEGDSDKFALEAAAEKVGRNLDREGITIVSLEGSGGLGTFLGILGPRGLGLRLSGLCDMDSEDDWMKKLQEAKVGTASGRDAMENLGFFVCQVDLEDELLRAIGVDQALAVVDQHGDREAFDRDVQQPANRGASLHEQLHGFLGRRGRKVTYAPEFVDRLDARQIPQPLLGALKHV